METNEIIALLIVVLAALLSLRYFLGKKKGGGGCCASGCLPPGLPRQKELAWWKLPAVHYPISS